VGLRLSLTLISARDYHTAENFAKYQQHKTSRFLWQQETGPIVLKGADLGRLS